MDNSDDNNHASTRKRKRYNKLLLDSNSIPIVSRQTLRRWFKYGKNKNETSKIINYFPSNMMEKLIVITSIELLIIASIFL